MNTQLGKKWFVFYTKVRPWICCIGLLSLLVDFLQYPAVYFSYWWTLLYLLTNITTVVLAILVFVNSKKDYAAFVPFVKIVLAVETFSIAFNQSVEQYLGNELTFIEAFFIFAILLVLCYFLWYRLNVKYFEKRLVCKSSDTPIRNYAYASRPPQISDGTETPMPYTTSAIYGADIKLQPSEDAQSAAPKTDVNSASSLPKGFYCRKCGAKLFEDSLYCSNCGTKVL